MNGRGKPMGELQQVCRVQYIRKQDKVHAKIVAYAEKKRGEGGVNMTNRKYGVCMSRNREETTRDGGRETCSGTADALFADLNGHAEHFNVAFIQMI